MTPREPPRAHQVQFRRPRPQLDRLRAQFKGAQGHITALGGQRRDHDCPDPEVMLLYFLEHLNAVHLRHHDIQHHQVEPGLARLIQCGPAIMSETDQESFRFKVFLEQSAQFGVVIGNEDGCVHGADTVELEFRSC